MVRIVSYPHTRFPLRSVGFSFFCGAGAAAAATSATVFNPVFFPASATPSAARHQVCELNGEDGANICPPLQIDHDGLERKGYVAPRGFEGL